MNIMNSEELKKIKSNEFKTYKTKLPNGDILVEMEWNGQFYDSHIIISEENMKSWNDYIHRKELNE